MKIEEKDILHIAALARLDVSGESIERLAEEMARIVGFADMIAAVDTEGADSAYISELYNVFREDMVLPSYDRDALLANAPDESMGLFQVPRVME